MIGQNDYDLMISITDNLPIPDCRFARSYHIVDQTRLSGNYSDFSSSSRFRIFDSQVW